jgi:hypothetical protein
MNNLLLANGQTITWPTMGTSGAGWQLRPDEARTEHELRRGLNKSFGRGYEGRKIANDWLRQHLQQQFDKADWADPVGWDFPGGYEPPIRGLSLSVKHAVYGWNTVRYEVRAPSRYGDGKWTVTYTWMGSNLQEWYRTKTAGTKDPHLIVDLAKYSESFDTRDSAIYAKAEEFAKDPTGVIESVLGCTLPWTAADLPPLDWNMTTGTGRFLDPLETIHQTIDDEHVFYKDGEAAQNVFIASDNQINKLERAFRHLGIDFRIRTGIQWGLPSHDPQYHKEILQGFTVSFPADPADIQNHRGHTVTVDLNGANIQCGYVEDDKKWQDWKARQAADWLNDFEQETLSTQTYEDYEYKPNQ